MKITNIPELLGLVAGIHSTSVDELPSGTYRPSAAAQLAGMVTTVLEMHEHTFWYRKPGKLAGFAVTEQFERAEYADCKTCGGLDAGVFWCPTVRQMFATYCELDQRLTDSTVEWPSLADAIHAAQQHYERPIANAIIRQITNPAAAPAVRAELADAVLASTPGGGS